VNKVLLISIHEVRGLVWREELTLYISVVLKYLFIYEQTAVPRLKAWLAICET